MVGRGRLLVVNHGEHNRRRLQKRKMGAPLHSHFSNDTLRLQEDHLFSRTGQAFFCFVSFLFFFLFFAFFLFFFGTRLLTLRNLRYVAATTSQTPLRSHELSDTDSLMTFFFETYPISSIMKKLGGSQ